MSAASVADRLTDHGIELRHDGAGTQRLPCPACGRGPRDSALAITVNPDGTVVWVCHRCGFKGCARERTESITKPPSRPLPRRAEPERHERLTERASALWAACVPITGGTVAAKYLEFRGCALPPVDSDLRMHADVLHWPTQQRFPALIGLITDAVTCTPLSLHFTFLKPDGMGKAGTACDKLLLPKHRKSGGVIRLWPDDAVTDGLGIAEGIETALSVAHAFTPVWACVDAANLGSFPVLPGIECLTIFCDHDESKIGERHAKACAERWHAAGREVFLCTPRAPGDWNDRARETA